LNVTPGSGNSRQNVNSGDMMQRIDLSGPWKVLERPMSCVGMPGLAQVRGIRSGWIPVQVPGEIHLDLIVGGRGICWGYCLGSSDCVMETWEASGL
jgi:hypothetical protein